MIRLAEPWWLLLAAPGFLFLAVWLVRRRWQRYPWPARPPWSGRGAAAVLATVAAGTLAALAFVPLAVAVARPQEVLAREVEHARGIDMVVALDVSGSMAALDFRPSDRLTVAKEVIDRFMARRPDDRIGVVVFAGAAVTLVPITLDHNVARRLLDRARVGMLPDGTAIGMGLGTAVNRLRRSKAASKVVVLVTDGSNNTGELDPMTATELAEQEGITVHTVLVGKGGEVPVPVKVRNPLTGEVVTRVRRLRVDVNPELLSRIAERTGGVAFEAGDPGALREVFDRIDAMEKTEFESARLVRYRERFEPWALGVLVLLVAAVTAEGLLGRTPW